MRVYRSTIVICLLVLSVGANAWMLAQRDAPPTSSVHSTSQGVRTLDGPVATRSTSVLAPVGVGDLLGKCHQQLVVANQALAAATEDQSQHIEPKKRFEEGARQPGMETRMSPLVERAISNVSGVIHYPVECRADLCQVRVSASTRDEANRVWRALTSDPTLRKASDGFSQDGGDPVIDVATGKGGFDVEIYLFTQSAANATAEIEALVEQFRASDAVASCASAGADVGVLEVRLSVDPERPTLIAAIGGDLGGTDVGRCISDKLLAALRDFKLPPGTRYGIVYASIVSPHGE